jgi:tetratricopeptide (TPR) repeat protein
MAQAAADALKEQGNKAFKEGDYAAAEELYTQACQRFSRNPLLFTNRANARLKLQRWEGAVNDCLKSIEISGRAQNHKAYYFLGECFSLLGEVLNLGVGVLGGECVLFGSLWDTARGRPTQKSKEMVAAASDAYGSPCMRFSN